MNRDRQQTHGPILTAEQLERYIREARRLRGETIGGGMVRLAVRLGGRFKRLMTSSMRLGRTVGRTKGRASGSGGAQWRAGSAPGTGSTATCRQLPVGPTIRRDVRHEPDPSGPSRCIRARLAATAEH